MVTRSYKVTVFTRTFGEKGALTSETVDENLSGLVNAPDEATARFVAQARALKAAEADLEDAEAVGALGRSLHIDVELVRPAVVRG